MGVTTLHYHCSELASVVLFIDVRVIVALLPLPLREDVTCSDLQAVNRSVGLELRPGGRVFS